MQLRYANILAILLILGTTAAFGKPKKKNKKRPVAEVREIPEAVQEIYVETSTPPHMCPVRLPLN